MKYTLAKREDIVNNEQPVKNEEKFKDLLIVFENGCVLGVDPHNHRTTLIDIIPRHEAEKTLENLSEGVVEFDDFEYNISEHPEYYFLEKGWLLKICKFLDKHKAFSIDAFNLSIGLSSNKVEGKNIAKHIVNKMLISDGYVTRTGSYFYVTQDGQMWARQKLQELSNLTEETKQDLIGSLPNFDTIRLKEIVSYKNHNYKEIFSTLYPAELSKLRDVKQDDNANAHLLARLIFWKYIPIAQLSEVLKFLKLDKKKYEEHFKRYNDYIKTERDDEALRKSEQNTKEIFYGKKKTSSSHTNDAPAPIESEEPEDDESDLDLDNEPEEESESKKEKPILDLPDNSYVSFKSDNTIDLINDPIYLKQRKIDIVRNHFSGDPALFSSSKHISMLVKMFKKKDKSLQLHMPGDCMNLLATLLYHKKLSRKEIFTYIKKHREYPHNISMKEIVKRFLEIGLMS